MTTAPFYEKLSHVLLSIALIVVFLVVGEHILIPLAFAALFTMLLIAPCNFLERIGISRGIAAMLSLLVALVVVVFIFYFISSQIISFRNDLPKVVAQLTVGLNDLETWARHKFHISSVSMRGYISSISHEALTSTPSIVGSTVATVSSTVIYLVLTCIYTFLFLLYRSLIVRFFVKSFHEDRSEIVMGILAKTRFVIKSYIVGLFIEMIIVALMNCIGFFILGVKYALLLGVLAALFNLIPYLGIFTACVLSMLITFTTNSPQTVIGVGIILSVVHLIDSNILLPRIVGSKVRINALATILAVIIGSAIWGVPMMFLAIPIVAILKVVFDDVEGLFAWGLILGDEIPTNVNASVSSISLAKRLGGLFNRKRENIKESEKENNVQN
jgi:putative permease